MMTEPGFKAPVASASSIMALAIRSFTEPAGLKYSSFTRTLAFSSSAFFNMGQLQQRGLANQLVSGCINLAHNYFLLYISQWCLFYGTGSRLMNHHIRRRHRNVFIFITNLPCRLIRIICRACWFVNSFFKNNRIVFLLTMLYNRFIEARRHFHVDFNQGALCAAGDDRFWPNTRRRGIFP